MEYRRILAALQAVALMGLILAAAVVLIEHGPGLFRAAKQVAEEEPHDEHGSRDRVVLSPQARANLQLDVRPLERGTYTRTVAVPGMIVERVGHGDQAISAPVAGVVTRIAALPGVVVQPGDELFALQIVSEPLQASQTELYKTVGELDILREQRRQLDKAAGAIPESKLMDLDFQQRRLATTAQALRFELTARGLNEEQIKGVTEGRFVTSMIVRAPKAELTHEVETLSVQIGDRVQAGQLLATLADHRSLLVEARFLKHETELVERAVRYRWPVWAEFPGEAWSLWGMLNHYLSFQSLSNRVDPESQTVHGYAPLKNEFHDYSAGGRTFRAWRFRPGQRVRLYVPVEQINEGFVLPADAVVREGAETYVFRANGEAFDRKPVRVLLEDRNLVVIADDGSVSAGNHVARHGAAALNRVLKSNQAGGGHGHDHHDHAH